jgi:hypothetical protein
MTLHEPDVVAVRSLAAEPTGESVTRSWYRITQLSARPEVSRRRFLIPVAAGVAMAMLGGGAALVFGRGDDGGQYLAGTPVKVVTALDTLAEAAALTEPVTIADGKLLYTEIRGYAAHFSGRDGAGEMEPQPREMWFEPNGAIVVKLTTDGTDMLSGPKSNHQAEMDEARAILAAEGPSIRRPTLAWLASLPADPSALLAELRRSTGTHDTWSVDQQLWDAMAGLYSSHEIAMSPQLRVALLRSFKGIDGLAAREITLDGRSLIAIRFTEAEHGDEILFDPQTGRAVGRSSLYFGDMTLVQPATGQVADPNVTYVATWTQKIVDPL